MSDEDDWTGYMPTMELRWAKGYEPCDKSMLRSVRVLQQKWRLVRNITGYGTDELEITEAWRDVPEVSESEAV